MRIDGEILPNTDSVKFTRERWCELVTTRSEFKRPTRKETTNPFTGEVMTVFPPDDAANVVIDGSVVGQVCWSMSDEPLVNISIESSRLEMAEDWAIAMGGWFRITE